MTCRELNAFLDDYLAGELPAKVHSAFQQHLEACPPCRDYLRSYRQAISTAQRVYEAPESEVPVTVPEVLVKAILKARARHQAATDNDPGS